MMKIIVKNGIEIIRYISIHFIWIKLCVNFICFSFMCFQAVKRSRVKTKQKTSQTKDRVDALKKSNEILQERITQKQKNLESLKSLFLETAKAKSEASNVSSYDLQALLKDSDDEDKK